MDRAPVSTFVNKNGLCIGNLLCQNNTDALLPIDWEEYEQSDEAYVSEVHSLTLLDEDALRLHAELTRYLVSKGLL